MKVKERKEVRGIELEPIEVMTVVRYSRPDVTTYIDVVTHRAVMKQKSYPGGLPPAEWLFESDDGELYTMRIPTNTVTAEVLEAHGRPQKLPRPSLHED